MPTSLYLRTGITKNNGGGLDWAPLFTSESHIMIPTIYYEKAYSLGKQIMGRQAAATPF